MYIVMERLKPEQPDQGTEILNDSWRFFKILRDNWRFLEIILVVSCYLNDELGLSGHGP